MVSVATPLRRPKRPVIDSGGVLNAVPTPVLVVDRKGVIQYLNLQGEAFFEGSTATLIGLPLDELVPPDSPVVALVGQVLADGNLVNLDGVTIHTPRVGPYFVNVQAGPYGEAGDMVVMTLQERSIARMIDNQLTHRNAARSVTAMAAMLAHEVKNPLSGIRGAAQLLDETVPEEDRVLTRLIRDEADRIVALVNRMEAFSDGRPLERAPVNIHSVLDHVRNVAHSGFARNIRFIENYDPSLPPVHGNRDQLIQVFLNMVKNAAEACPEQGGEIILSTSYHHGVRVTAPGTEGRVHLPLLVSVQDNGEGIPDDLRPHLFDPFVTTKRNGTGLGLALVAKIIGDHGGVIEFDSLPRRTVFKVSLPMYDDVDLPAATTDGPSRELS